MLFQWLAYGDDDGVDDCVSRPSDRLQLIYIGLTGARIGDMGFCALVRYLERLKTWHQMDMSISPSSSPDGIRGLQLQNVGLYFHFLDLL